MISSWCPSMSLLDGRHMSPSSSSIWGAASAAPDADFRRSMICNSSWIGITTSAELDEYECHTQ